MQDTPEEKTTETSTGSVEPSTDVFAPVECERWEETTSVSDVEVLPPERSDAISEGRPRKAGGFRKFGTIGLVLFFLFGKLKYLGLILQIGKFKTFFSMLVSIWAYAMFWGWSFAAGFVVLIFIHEMGHVLALRMMGIRASAPMFIPFVGAHIVMQQMPKNAFSESVAAYGALCLGPLVPLAASASERRRGISSGMPLLRAAFYSTSLTCCQSRP